MSTNSIADENDPFAGYGPQPVKCRWHSADDERRAVGARIVRLIVDDNRRGENWVNAVYQRHALADASAFLGDTTAVVVTPAGMITVAAADEVGDLASQTDEYAEIERALASLDLGSDPREWLLGIEACDPGVATPNQTLVHEPISEGG